MPTKRKTTRKAREPHAVATTPSTALAPEDKPLNDLETMFVEQYFLSHMNATEAAVQTYDVAKRITARAVGSETLNRPHVRAAIKARLQQIHMQADEVLARISIHARGNMGDFLTHRDGRVGIDIEKAEEAAALGLLKKVKVRETATDNAEVYEVEIEVYDAQVALRDLGRALHMFNDDIPVQQHQHLHLYVNGKPLTEQRTLTAQTVDTVVIDE